MIALATNVIHPDEKAYILGERNLIRPPLHEWRRYQVIVVNRDDQLAEWWDDLGPAEDFTAPGLDVLSEWEHTVAELQDIAERQRLGEDYWQKRLVELEGESTLIPDFLNYKEEAWKVINNQSVFGPGVSKQRIGFSKEAAYAYQRVRQPGH